MRARRSAPSYLVPYATRTIYKDGSATPKKKIMSSISILHRSCLRLGLLPFSPLRARATTRRLPLPQPRRHLHPPPRRSAMSSAASRLSHIAAATGGGGGAAGESDESPPAASAAAQEDDGTSRSLGAIVALSC
jgi:hypothetical protein